MISIVIAVKDNKLYTKLCVESIMQNTKHDYELIIVDNASGQETKEYLESLSCNLIRNIENKGCAYAWNQGIKASNGEYVCIINNDIIVPGNWLKSLEDIYKTNNYVLLSPGMREGDLDYNLNEYNEKFAYILENRFFVDEYRGVCLFAKKSFYEGIGCFDENFKIGKFEDEDLFMRIKENGQQTAVTTSILVHHYGSKTINDVKKGKTTFEQENRIYFHKKWKHKRIYRKINKIKVQLRRKLIKLKYGVLY